MKNTSYIFSGKLLCIFTVILLLVCILYTIISPGNNTQCECVYTLEIVDKNTQEKIDTYENIQELIGVTSKVIIFEVLSKDVNGNAAHSIGLPNIVLLVQILENQEFYIFKSQLPRP